MSTTETTEEWYRLPVVETANRLSTDVDNGLTASQQRRLLSTVGPNEIAKERPPSLIRVVLGQFRDPMTLMLIVVAVVSFVIAQPSTAWVVLSLVGLNVVLGTNQEMKAKASVSALANMQIPTANVTRDSAPHSVPATELVPGDLVSIEAGDLIPADGRLVAAASLETQEAALTGESAPVAKAVDPITGTDVPLGDRASMVFQNTSVTRGTGRFLVTATGMRTEVGQIAGMLEGVQRTRSPLQRQLDDMTKKIAMVAWGALAVILVVGLVRGLPFADAGSAPSR